MPFAEDFVDPLTRAHGNIGIKSISNVVKYFRNEEATATSFIDGYFIVSAAIYPKDNMQRKYTRIQNVY
ncbi:MAG: hypothetical protein ACSHWT_13055 [Glaciecola sp.]